MHVPFRHTQLLLRSAVAGLAAAEPSSGLAGWLPTEGLGLAPCALAGILLAAAEQVSWCRSRRHQIHRSPTYRNHVGLH